jgi:HEAT repeat protein
MKKFQNRDIQKTRQDNDITAEALLRFRTPLVHYLISGLSEEDKWVRCFAAEMLGNVRDPVAAGSLIPLLTDPDEDLRAGAAGALDAIGHSRMVFTQVQKSGCDTCLIRMIAQEALATKKTGEDAKGRQWESRDGPASNAACGYRPEWQERPRWDPEP